MAKSVSDIGNGLGLLYVTDKTGLIGGKLYTVDNDAAGARRINGDGSSAFNVASGTKAFGYVDITNISNPGDVVDSLTINGVEQITPPATAASTDTAAFAIVLAQNINDHTPGSGVNYVAQAEGSRVWIFPPDGAGSTVNGHAISVNGVGITTADSGTIEGGDDGTGLVNENYGLRFFIDADYGTSGCPGSGTADPNSLANALEITDYVINQGLQTAANTQAIVMNTTAKTATITRKRNYQFIELTTGAGASDLESINTNGFNVNDVIVCYGGNAAQVITFKDNVGNIELQSNDDFLTGGINNVIALRLVDDPTLGRVWSEIWRSPSNVADGSITTAKLAAGAVTNNELAANSVAAANIQNGAVGPSALATDSVVTDKIEDDAVTTPKIVNNAVTEDKILNDAVTTNKISDSNVTTDKLANSAVTAPKLATNVKTIGLPVTVSFETDEQGDMKVYIPYNVTITSIEIAVSKLIEATDDASIEALNGAASMGVTSLTQGSAIGTEFQITGLSNNSVTAGTYVTLRTSKTTDGGKAIVTIVGTLQ